MRDLQGAAGSLRHGDRLVEIRGIADREIRVDAHHLVALLQLEIAFVAGREHADLVCVSMQNALEDWKTEQNARRKAAAQEAKSV